MLLNKSKTINNMLNQRKGPINKDLGAVLNIINKSGDKFLFEN